MNACVIVLSKTPELVSKMLRSFAGSGMAGLAEARLGWNGTDAGLEQVLDLARTLGIKMEARKFARYGFAYECDELARESRAQKLVFSNDDVEFREDCLSPVLEALDRPGAGTVGIRLLYPDGTVQHAGVFVRENGGELVKVGHCLQFETSPRFSKGSAMEGFGSTGAFLGIRKDVFERLGGFDRGYLECLEDVQLNLACLAAGLKNRTLLDVSAFHVESATRPPRVVREDAARLCAYWRANRDRIMKGFRA